MRAAADQDVVKRARSRAGARIGFLGHGVVYVATFLLLAFIWLPAAIIVALAWGIGLAAHGFFAVIAPMLREHWVERELAQAVPRVRADERRLSEGRHARDVERLAASLAHEIRNPIAAAKSLVRQIGEDPTGPDAREYARVAEAELDRVETSIAHLLRFAREEPLRTREVRLTAVIAAALDSAAERTAGVRVQREITDAPLDADEDKLRRAVLNLVANAADAVRPLEPARHELRVEAGPSFDGAEIWIRVVDRGPGIDAAMRDRVFEPWVTGKDAGTGLGLPIARKLCEAHGGSLEIERTGEDGTAMLITLPARATGAEAR